VRSTGCPISECRLALLGVGKDDGGDDKPSRAPSLPFSDTAALGTVGTTTPSTLA